MRCAALRCALLLQVRRMIVGACEAWLRDYRMDGLRFDSIKDVPMDMVQVGAGGHGGVEKQLLFFWSREDWVLWSAGAHLGPLLSILFCSGHLSSTWASCCFALPAIPRRGSSSRGAGRALQAIQAPGT